MDKIKLYYYNIMPDFQFNGTLTLNPEGVVSINGNIAIVGSPDWDAGPTNTGAVYIYYKNAQVLGMFLQNFCFFFFRTLV